MQPPIAPPMLRNSQVKNVPIKYLEGAYLDRLVSPDTSAAYSQGMLEVLRGDTKKQIKVKAPHTKKGYYYRSQEVSDQPETAGKSRVSLPSTKTLAIGGGIAASLAIGAAAGAGVALWQSQEGTRKQVAEAQQNAERQVQRETVRVRQEAEAKYGQQAEQARQEAEQRVQAETAKARQEAETQFAAQTEEVRRQAAADVDAVGQRSQAEIDRITQESEQRVKQGIEAGTAEEREKLAQQSQDVASQAQAVNESAKALERSHRERTKTLEKSVADRTSGLEREHQQRLLELDRKAQQMEVEHADRLQKLEESSRAELAERTSQVENRVNAEKLAEIAKAREDATNGAIAQIRQEQQAAEDKRIAGRTGRGKLISSEETGVALAASARRDLDLSILPPETLKARVNDAVDKLVGDRHARALDSLAPELRQRAQEIRAMAGRDSRKKWEAMEHTLIQHGNRENGLAGALGDIKQTYKQKHQEALDKVLSQPGGLSDPATVTKLDKKLAKLNADMQREITKAIEQVKKDAPLDQPFLGRKRGDAVKLVHVKASGDRKAYDRRIKVGNPVTRTVRRARKEVQRIVRTGKGREYDIKPALEAGVTAAVGAIAPDAVSPLAAGAAQFGMRSWRLSYEEVAKSGIQGLFEGFQKLSDDDRRALYSDTMTKVVASAVGKATGGGTAEFSPDIETPVGVSVDVGSIGAGTTAGVSASRAIRSISQQISRRLVKSDAYWNAFEDFLGE